MIMPSCMSSDQRTSHPQCLADATMSASKICTGVAHEDVQSPELTLDLVEHPLDVLGTRDVGLDQAPLGSARLHLGQGLLRGLRLGVIVDRDVDAALGQLQGDTSPDPARASRDERMFPLECHGRPPSQRCSGLIVGPDVDSWLCHGVLSGVRRGEESDGKPSRDDRRESRADHEADPPPLQP